MSFNKTILLKKYIPLTIFAIAMGFLEAIVVVYVRELYYPEGFNFPLKPLPDWLILIEIVRELCTLLMLGSVAWLAGKNFLQRLAVFLFLFGVWDIFYYVGLEAFLNWPESFLTWDILFLIPITWLGPVLAPIICSVVMTGMAILFEWLLYQQKTKKIKGYELALLFIGAGFIFYTFIFDFGKIIIKEGFLNKLAILNTDTEFNSLLSTFVPNHYQWGLFSIGIIIILTSVALLVKRSIKK